MRSITTTAAFTPSHPERLATQPRLRVEAFVAVPVAPHVRLDRVEMP